MKDEFKKKKKGGGEEGRQHNLHLILLIFSSLNTDKTVADILEDLKKESQKQKKALV